MQAAMKLKLMLLLGSTLYTSPMHMRRRTGESCGALRVRTAAPALTAALRLRGGADSSITRSLPFNIAQRVDKATSFLGRDGEPAGLMRVGIFAFFAFVWPLIGKLAPSPLGFAAIPFIGFFIREFFLQPPPAVQSPPRGWREGWRRFSEITPHDRISATLLFGAIAAIIAAYLRSDTEMLQLFDVVLVGAISLTYLIHHFLRALGHQRAAAVFTASALHKVIMILGGIGCTAAFLVGHIVDPLRAAVGERSLRPILNNEGIQILSQILINYLIILLTLSTSNAIWEKYEGTMTPRARSLFGAGIVLFPVTLVGIFWGAWGVLLIVTCMGICLFEHTSSPPSTPSG
jgi:hypothetical protein